MAFAIGSPPASQQASRAPTPADELLRMRLQAVEAVEFRGTALLGAEPSPRCSSGAATPGLKASQGRHRPSGEDGTRRRFDYDRTCWSSSKIMLIRRGA